MVPHLISSHCDGALAVSMTQDMIGGRFLLVGEAGLANSSAVLSTVGTAGQAQRAATAEQWTSVFLRHLVVAVTCEFLTIQQALAHQATVTYFIYDEMARTARASRVRSGETFDRTKETTSEDKHTVDMATL